VADLSALRLVTLNRAVAPIDSSIGDPRGAAVVTADDENLGIVSDLLVDAHRQTIRFFEVDAGRHDPAGSRVVLIPIELVERSEANQVLLGCPLDVVLSSPAHNPHMIHTVAYLREVFEHYGLPIPNSTQVDHGSEQDL
jgi:hypothetical protein